MKVDKLKVQSWKLKAQICYDQGEKNSSSKKEEEKIEEIYQEYLILCEHEVDSQNSFKLHEYQSLNNPRTMLLTQKYSC